MSSLLQHLGGAKPCDYCKISSALLFCRVDSAFLCMGCDAKIHAMMTNKLGHEKVWICEVSRRHERVPVVPFYDTAEAVVKTTASIHLDPASDTITTKQVPFLGHENYADSCVFAPETPDLKSVEFLLSQSDQLLEFDYPISSVNHDSVVPVQTMDLSLPPSKNHFEIDFTKSNITSFKNGFTTPSLMHSVSSSSMDVGVVPDGSSISETSYSFGKSISNVVDFSGGKYQSAQVLGMDREARVMRYREKRKNRKFEKTIRYASRKAYAEKRPRIKGRFAKRTEAYNDVDGEIGQLFGTASAGFSITDSRFCLVPTFQ
ncbi:hypothetical protein Leryth_012286 [Lithospermum erythrorhizon]|nr:hypothetical protein Leryth_012286 [Lithospermum erythrorhizon]